MATASKAIAVIGGGGYVGSALVPELLRRGYRVKVLDLFLFGETIYGDSQHHPQLSCVKVDIRNEAALHQELKGQEAVIHLACISNDPSFELDPVVGKSINYDAMPGFLRAVRACGIRRMIYASSSSVYGVKEEPDVREEAVCQPLTDYSKFKLICEQMLASENLGDTEYVILRPATVCGYATRLRLDLTVNILTIHALVKKEITVFGGSQLRPNIHIQDMVEAYLTVLEAPAAKIHKQIFNVGYNNMAVEAIARLVRKQLKDESIQIRVQPANDLRSYHVNSDKIRSVLGFQARHSIEDAVESIAQAFRAGRIPEPLTRPDYYNIKVIQSSQLKNPQTLATRLP